MYSVPWHSHTANYKSYDKEIGNGIASFGSQIAPESNWGDLNSKIFLGEDPIWHIVGCHFAPPNFIKPWLRPLLGNFLKETLVTLAHARAEG